MQNLEAVLQAERAVLSGALVDPVAADRAVEILVASDFIDQINAQVFAAIAQLAMTRQTVDIVSVRQLLVPGIGFGLLAELAAQNPANAVYVASHAEIVLQASMRRQIVAAASEMRSDAETATPRAGLAGELMEAFLGKLDAIRHRMPSRGPIQLAKAEPDLVPRVIEDTPTPPGLKTGFYDLDVGQGLLRDGEMIVLAARPSVGKSLLASNIAEHLAIAEKPTPVLVFSMEMSAGSLYRRYLFGRSGVQSTAALAGFSSDEDKAALREAHRELRGAPWYVHDQPAMTAAKVHSISRRFQNHHGKGLIIVDYLQLMAGPGGSRYEVVTNLSSAMKALAVDLQCPVLVLAQLNRAVDKHEPRNGERGDAIPVLSDLRDSGAIEQDADVVIFLARDVMKSEPHPVHVVVAKNRPGKTGKAQLLFDTAGPRFRNVSKVEAFT